MHWGIVLPEVFKVNVGGELCVSKGFACPDLVHKACRGIPTPRASAISFVVVSVMLSSIPDTKGLNGSELVALGVGAPSDGKVEGDLVKGPKVSS